MKAITVCNYLKISWRWQDGLVCKNGRCKPNNPSRIRRAHMEKEGINSSDLLIVALIHQHRHTQNKRKQILTNEQTPKPLCKFITFSYYLWKVIEKDQDQPYSRSGLETQEARVNLQLNYIL